MTEVGKLDVLVTIWNGVGYEGLRPRTETMMIDGNAPVKVLNLDTLIEVKEDAGRPKDLTTAYELRAIRSQLQFRLPFENEDSQQ